tara:strand:- start:18 stop:374 length:357 start_codon:yes stop_codon:yes gene_type:complete
MGELNIFKVEYDWYEGEHSEVLVGKNVNQEDFEKDLLKARDFAENLKGKKVESGETLGKCYRVECLPEFYEQILWYLCEKLSYVYCCYDENICYSVDDDFSKRISIIKEVKKTERKEM